MKVALAARARTSNAAGDEGDDGGADELRGRPGRRLLVHAGQHGLLQPVLRARLLARTHLPPHAPCALGSRFHVKMVTKWVLSLLAWSPGALRRLVDVQAESNAARAI